MDNIEHNIELNFRKVCDDIALREKHPNSVRLVAVSKFKPERDILALYNLGHRHFGENYVQELVTKARNLPPDIQWHFIGHLQSGKAKELIRSVPNLHTLESVDSLKLATKLDNVLSSTDSPPLRIYIQVDTSNEDTKSGVAPSEVVSLVNDIKNTCSRLIVAGLMTIGAPGDYTCFDKLVECRDNLYNAQVLEMNSIELSMGMSSDFGEAIDRGATSVRIGSTIFGSR